MIIQANIHAKLRGVQERATQSMRLQPVSTSHLRNIADIIAAARCGDNHQALHQIN